MFFLLNLIYNAFDEFLCKTFLRLQAPYVEYGVCDYSEREEAEREENKWQKKHYWLELMTTK